MQRYLIEVPHESSTRACNRAIDSFLRTGSHFLTHADWGCKDGEHKAWFIVEAESKDEARNVVPADYRPHAKVTRLTQFKREDIPETMRIHDG